MPKIGLALSGGGVRAAVFHLGVFRRLADQGLLEDVGVLSTVSGGSLVTALIFSHADMRWPTSEKFRSTVLPQLRDLITTSDLFTFRAIGLAGVGKYHVKLVLERARVLADMLGARWGVRGKLKDLPDSPTWWINTTCIETGKNWRFSKREMGDWVFGRHYDPPVSIAEAAAASAAVPYVIGALGMTVPTAGWYKTNPATRQPVEQKQPPYAKVHLWDGGAYENLGLEPIFKQDQPLIGCDFAICSDASGPLAPPSSPVLRLLRGHLGSPRLFDIASDQIRALRSRMFVRALDRGDIKGALIRMGNSVRDIDLKAGRERAATNYDRYQADQEAIHALRHPTDLAALAPDVFDRIARHGYEVADATLTAYAPDVVPASLDWQH